MITKQELLKDVLIYDIECWSDYDIDKQNEEYLDDAKIKWIGFYSFKSKQKYKIPFTGNEELIKKFVEEHKVVVGFNNEWFDDPIMKNSYNNVWPKKRRISLDLKKILTPDIGCKNRGKEMGLYFKKNSLKEVAKSMKLDISKGDIDYRIFKKDSWTDEEIEEIKRYLDLDIELTKQIFLKTFDFWFPFASWVSEKNRKNWTWLSSSVASLCYKYCCNLMNWGENYGQRGLKTDGGGRVKEPTVPEAYNVWYVDVTSLYPHLYAMFALLSEVLAGTPGAWHGNEVFKVNGYYDISKPHKLAVDMMEKLKYRIELKKKDPDNPMVYCIKIFLNTIYGANRSELFEDLHTENSGEDCCWLGRQVNHIMEKMGNEMGYTTIAADTDSNFWVHKEKKTYEEVKADLKKIVDFIQAHCPFPQETFNIDIEDFIYYISFSEDDKKKKKKKKNYYYVCDKKGKKKLKIKGLPVSRIDATLLGPLILEKYLKPQMLEKGIYKFDNDYVENLIKEELENDLSLMLVEYRPKPYDTYSLKGKRCLTAQISKNYLDKNGGFISLIKNKRVGKAGSTFKYCTIEEARENNLRAEEIDLTKVYNELSPFSKEPLIYKKRKKVQKNGFFNNANPVNSFAGVKIEKRGFF